MYGVNFTPTGSGMKFGLNQGVKMIKFGFNPNGGKDGAPQDCLDLVFNIGGREISNRQFPITKVRDWENEVDIEDKKHPLFVSQVNKFNAYMTQLMLCFATKEDIQETFDKEQPENFKQYCNVCLDIIGEDYAEQSLDLFTHYQWSIRPGSDRKYLELPRYTHINQGLWVISAQEGIFTKVDGGEGLKYINEDGKTHPFTRDGRWVASERAKDGKVTVEPGAPADADFDF